jgi:hypothetical protein
VKCVVCAAIAIIVDSGLTWSNVLPWFVMCVVWAAIAIIVDSGHTCLVVVGGLLVWSFVLPWFAKCVVEALVWSIVMPWFVKCVAEAAIANNVDMWSDASCCCACATVDSGLTCLAVVCGVRCETAFVCVVCRTRYVWYLPYNYTIAHLIRLVVTLQLYHCALDMFDVYLTTIPLRTWHVW